MPFYCASLDCLLGVYNLLPFLEAVLESNEGKRFSTLLTCLFDFHDEAVGRDCGPYQHTQTTNTSLQSESIVLQELCVEAAKLKESGSLARVPQEVLSRLVTILDSYVKGASSVSLFGENEEKVQFFQFK